MENKVIFKSNKLAERYWCRYFLKKAMSTLAEKQLKDELRYTKGVLDMNNIGIIFSEKTHKGWEKRAKDFVYGYWTEEDIRLKLASELSVFQDCQVHGQIHICGTKNVRYGYKPKGFHIHMLKKN